MPSTMPGGGEWPRFTVVTPSFNQARYLEETIRSVLLQGYPNLEYLVMDGGSSDGSVEIIRKYDPWLTYWVSQSDKGQSDAINKGMGRSTGDVQAWLNSDDVFYPGAIELGVRDLVEADADIIIAGMNKVRFDGDEIRVVKFTHGGQGVPIHPYPIFKAPTDTAFSFMQPSMFWRTWCWEATGGLNPDYHWVMDVEWCTRALAAGAKVATSDTLIARFLLHGDSKTEMYNHLQHHEWAGLYLRLARSREFRVVPCLLSWAREERKAALLLAKGLRAQGARFRPWLYRAAGGFLGLAQRLSPPPVAWVGPPRAAERAGDSHDA